MGMELGLLDFKARADHAARRGLKKSQRQPKHVASLAILGRRTNRANWEKACTLEKAPKSTKTTDSWAISALPLTVHGLSVPSNAREGPHSGQTMRKLSAPALAAAGTALDESAFLERAANAWPEVRS